MRQLSYVKHEKEELARALVELKQNYLTDMTEASQSLLKVATEREKNIADRYEKLKEEIRQGMELGNALCKRC